MLPPTPWTYDGHGINDADGTRIATIAAELKTPANNYGQELGQVLGTAPQVREAMFRLRDACDTLLDICRYKCTPRDLVILPNGSTNEQAMLEAMAAIASVSDAIN